MNNEAQFKGIKIGISISPSAESFYRNEDMKIFTNRFTYQLARNILLEGGQVVLGHQWRPDGVMAHLAQDARSFQSFVRSGELKADVEYAPIINIMAWPDAAPTDDHTIEEFIKNHILYCQSIPPAGFTTQECQETSGQLKEYLRIRALTAMRHELVKRTDIRFCAGGALPKTKNRLPGLIEEAIMTIQAGKPILISSALGGVSQSMADLILQRRLSDEAIEQFYTVSETVQLMESWQFNHPYPIEEGPSIRFGSWNAYDYLRNIKLEDLAKSTGLTVDEYIRMMTTPDLERASAWLNKAAQAFAENR
jgi:hypothetical protein